MTKNEVEKIRNYPVIKSNEMIQKTSFVLSKQEYNLLQFIISKIKPEDTKINPVFLSISEFCLVCGLNESGKNYENVKNSIKSLADKSVWFDDGKTERLVRWIEDPEIEKMNGVIKIQLKEIWHDHLIQLKEYYTRINMNDIIPMKSVYGRRMYELLMSYQINIKGSYFVSFKVNEIKEKLLGKDGAKKKYKEYRDFKAKCLKPALRDMQEYGVLDINMKEKRLGRSVNSLEFIVKIKKIEERLLAGKQSIIFFGIDN